MPVDPTMGLGGAEWRMPQIGGVGDGQPAGGGDPANGPDPATGFGGMLGQALGSLTQMQTEAATGAQSLATGTAQDPASVVLAVERAQLSMQLAGQVRTKLVEAAQDLLHTQI